MDISKEIEFQELEIELAKKRIGQYKEEIVIRKTSITKVDELHKDRIAALDLKKGELEAIISETKEKEEELLRESAALEIKIDERLLNAYKRLKKNAVNSLSIVKVEFSIKIPTKTKKGYARKGQRLFIRLPEN